MLREWTFSLENNLFFLFFFICNYNKNLKRLKSEYPIIFSKSITSLAAKGINFLRALNFRYKVIQSEFQKSKNAPK